MNALDGAADAGRTLRTGGKAAEAAKAAGRLDNVGDGARAAKTGDYSVYVLRDPATKKVKYVGMAKRDPNVRWAEHNRLGSKTANLELDVQMRGVSRAEARGAEQYLYEMYGGKPALLNSINPVTPKNQPFFVPFGDAALKRWGVIL